MRRTQAVHVTIQGTNEPDSLLASLLTTTGRATAVLLAGFQRPSGLWQAWLGPAWLGSVWLGSARQAGKWARASARALCFGILRILKNENRRLKAQTVQTAA